MNIQRNIDLTAFNTFGLKSVADRYTNIRAEKDLVNIDFSDDLFILGGGSNVLLPSKIDARVLHMSIDFIRADETKNGEIQVEIGAGVNWHRFVTICVEMGWGGIENLALIPGLVGAAPVQNIGAYGVELEDVFISLRALDRHTGKFLNINKKECAFNYRNSIFKSQEKDRYIITSVCLRLKSDDYKPNTSYYAIQEEMKRRNIKDPGMRDLYNMVIDIRSRKLPDPDQLGNSGSFFKNPIVDEEKFAELLRIDEDMKSFKVEDGFKIPAGYLIEACGWKGRRVGNTGCYEKQALVIVNYGGATSEEVVAFVKQVQESVSEQFGIWLEPEVNIIGN